MRTYLVTGAASGIGKATAELLAQGGDTVIAADLRDADVNVDLSTAAGRQTLVTETARFSGGTLDGIVAVAGVGLPSPVAVAVNYFGMTATLEGLRPLLAGSDAPRAVGVSSGTSLQPFDDTLVDLMLGDDEAGALARAADLAGDPSTGALIYPSTKAAFARWIRRHAASTEWAAAGIPLNAVAPAIVLTPMVAPYLETEEGRREVVEATPMPLNGFMEPIVVARLLAWVAGPENTHLAGQVVFVDGGYEVVTRGDSTW